MAWPLDDRYLLDATPKHDWGVRPATDGVIFHTTEGAGPTRTDALNTARWQQSNPGSYNWIVYDGGVLLTVLPRNACGGLNPASPYWNPEPWLGQLLPARARANPTMYHAQIAFSGKARSMAAGTYPANMIDTAARLLRWLETRSWAADNLVVSGHVHWQDNRTDPGAGVIDRILAEYEMLTAPPLPDTSTPPTQLEACTADLAAARLRVTRLRSRLANAEAIIAAARDALGTAPPGD